MTNVQTRSQHKEMASPPLEPLVPPSPTPASTSTTFVRPVTVEREVRRDLNTIVHLVLVVGLIISTILLIIGVVLGLLEQRPMPNSTISAAEAVRRLIGLRPSGFLNLGLLVLIVTPVLRVVGSVVVFLYEHDWRYAGITALVLVIMLFSLLSGQGG